ncbi:OLC1v1025571C1 [Oldenlandia corymbosa var. corymbosa]|uniref:OLC1v1025571C1 n=1 Tax=Oldenlandia corymbosa var. corymbosa TaxID=529605 RepID=A0AAV1C6V9_OLDCO|nr:OLC1v1025571C1 [Oldenlandia corymbosa var. corymbosa]
MKLLKSLYGDEEPYVKIENGTTVMGFICKQGVMVAADHSFCSVDNIIALNPRMLIAITGDIKAGSLLPDLRSKYRQDELTDSRIRSSVVRAAFWVKNTMPSLNTEGLPLQILIAGWDETLKTCFYAGSGYPSAHVSLFLGDNGKSPLKMSFVEASKYARDSIVKAASAVADKDDGCGGDFGGFVSAYCVGADGCKVAFYNDDVLAAAAAALKQDVAS